MLNELQNIQNSAQLQLSRPSESTKLRCSWKKTKENVHIKQGQAESISSVKSIERQIRSIFYEKDAGRREACWIVSIRYNRPWKSAD